MRKTIILLYAVFAIATILSCANRGAGPQGGPQDVTPPQVVRYSPADGSTHMTRKRIEITFDEIVVLQNATQKVVVSPPQRTPADIKAISHKIIVEFADTLLDSTTYSIDFTDAIADNNEGNKLDGFTYCFSTGDYLDSLEIAGRVLRADNLNPSVGIIVGVHSMEPSCDTAFTTRPFSRIAKTNDRGEFVIRNLPAGRYAVYALSDVGGNFIKDMPGEEIAFLDTSFVPTRTVETQIDTLRNPIDSTLVDTVIRRTKVTTSPDDLLLMSFVEKDTRRFFDKVQRPDRYRLVILFTGADTLMPTLTPLNFADTLFEPVITYNETRDTITYWLRDTSLWSQDTLSCLLAYYRRDVDSTSLATDTVSFIFRHAQSAKPKAKNSSVSHTGKKKKERKPSTPRLSASNASSKFDINTPLIVKFAMPTEIRPHDTVSYHLQMKEDTLWRDLQGARLEMSDDAGTTYSLAYDWKPTSTYRLLLDSSLLVNMIGQTNALEIAEFTVKSLEEYSKLILHLTGVSGCEVIQLLNNKDEVVRQIALTGGTDHPTITFDFIAPGVYYMRLFSDDNHDGVWSPGLYSERRQPEEVIYFPYDIELRAFWDVEEDWNPQTTRLAKPRELIQTEKKK